MPVRTRRSKALEASKEAPDVQEADHAAAEAATPPPAAQQGGSAEWSAEEEDMYGDDSDGQELEEVILDATHPAAAADGEGEEEEEEEEAYTPPPATGSKRRATKKQQPAKKKPKKEKPKKISQVRLCVTTVKKRYGLNDKDLEGLDVKYDYNPWGPHPMRLYKKGEVEQVAAAKAAQRQWEEDHKEELAAQRLAAQKQRKAEQMAQAKAAVERFAARAAAAAAAKQQQREGDDGVVLPVEVLEAVMGSFTISSVRPDALMGVWGAATAIAQAAAASSTWYLASKAALQTLAAAVPPQLLLAAFPQLPGPLGWEAWDAVVQEPASLKLDQLKEAARVLGTTISGTKPQLVVRLLERLGLDAPRALPARLHLALQEEKRRFLVDVATKLPVLGAQGNAVAAAAVSAPWQHWQALAAEFPTMAALQAAYQAARAKQFSSLYTSGWQGGGVQQQRQPRVGGGPGQGPAPPGGWCACGNAAKRGCSSHRCGTCCRRLGGGQCAVHFF